MDAAFVLLIFGFSNSLFIIQHVESVPRNEGNSASDLKAVCEFDDQSWHFMKKIYFYGFTSKLL